jgi:hypothetical protein
MPEHCDCDVCLFNRRSRRTDEAQAQTLGKLDGSSFRASVRAYDDFVLTVMR